jgi:hypothetical protein
VFWLRNLRGSVVVRAYPAHEAALSS